MQEQAEGKLIVVRAYCSEDVDPPFAAVTESIDELAKYETWCHPGYTREEAAEYVNQVAGGDEDRRQDRPHDASSPET